MGEVWFWRRGRLQVFRLGGGEYTPAERSAVLPEMDLGLVAGCMDAPSQTEAVALLRAAAQGA